ncbi:MAG: toluene tolerance protein [Micavibrio sp.]|nr:toluene tolerance protein [Micavibrio sp.]
MTFIKSVFLAFFLLTFSPVAFAADDTAKAESFIDARVKSALEFIGDKDLPFDEKKKKFSGVLESSFDLKTIARFSLGRYWHALEDSDKPAYFSAFKEYIVNVYSQRFKDYSGEVFKTTGARIDQNGDVLVNSSLIPADGAAVSVTWRVRDKKGGMKVVDVMIEGVSMAVTQRSDFSSIVSRNGGDVSMLLAHLQDQNKKLAAQ